MKPGKKESTPVKRNAWHVLRSKKVMVFLGSVFALSMILAGGTAAYVGLVMPNEPQNVLRSSLATTLTPIRNRKEQVTHIDISANGNANGKRTSLNVSGNISANGRMDVTAKLVSGLNGANLNGRFISPDGKNTYFNISGLKALDKQLLYGGYTDQRLTAGYALSAVYPKLDGKWILVTKNLGYDTGQAQARVSNVQSQIVQAYKSNEFFQVNKKLPDQVVAGMSSYHYIVAVNPTRLQNFETQLKLENQSAIQAFNPYLYTIIAKDKGSSNRTFDVWIDKRTKYISRISFSYYYNQNYNFRATITLSQLNRPINITAPKGAQPIKPILDKAHINPIDVLLGTYYPTLNR